jgi:hypothetical protein
MCLETRAYFAGLYDGEGHIMIRESRRGNGKSEEMYLALTLQVVIANTCRTPLAEGQEQWGGRVYETVRAGRPTLYRWNLGSHEAADFLVDVFPYTRIKRTQTAFALEFQDRVDAITHRKRRSEEEMAERYRLREAIQALNQRKYYGPPPVLRAVGGGCLNCGCGQPSNRHGSQANITAGDLRAATRTAAHRTGTGGDSKDAHAEMGRTLRRGRSGKSR